MIKFYDIDENYIKFLKTIDTKIPDIDYDSHNKFVCGVVFSIDDIDYYAPVSHFNKEQKTNFPIYNKGKIIATIRFCFMFPVPSDVLTLKDFSEVAKIDKEYANLLNTEYFYCKSHTDEIIKKARSVYAIGCNKKHFLNQNCCDFKKLEKHYTEYKK